MNTISTKEVQRRTLKFDTIEQCVEELTALELRALKARWK